MTTQAPSGTVTFLLTDLVGSTRLWEQDADAMKAAMVRHDEILEKTIAANGGFIFSRMGDGMASAFSSAGNAASAAVAINRELAEENWRTEAPLAARIGLHTAEAVIVDDSGYASLPINRCSRLMSAAHGGQIVISGATEALVRDQLPIDIELTDLGEHRLRDLGSPIRVFQLSRVGLGEDFPRLRSLDTFPGNLPAQVSSFVGRKSDIARVVAALGQSRVATVTGVGGVGKTRLAIQVAADLLPRYRDGAWLVELAPIRDGSGVVEAVAAAFHITNTSGQSREDLLVEMLARKQLLLVLDNCEHLLASTAALVSRIERSCPGVAVLATSREGLAIDGEQLIALPPLDAGKPEDDIQQLVQTDAVALFVERTLLVKADFRLTDDNAPTVVSICQRLDGVPLAIELAAARVIALSPADLLIRLDRRFKVLAGGRRGAVGRHATLRAAIDWSHELLEPAEQVLLARMSVFSGGCTLAAIEEVCSGDPVDREDVLDLVTSLVSRSLVIADDSGVSTRYRLLETIREYAEEKLDDRGEIDSMVARHGLFYAELSAHAAENSYGPDQLVWARQVILERDNLRAALANAIDCENCSLAVRLVINYPHPYNQATTPMGPALVVPAARVAELADAAREIGYPRVLAIAAYEASTLNDFHRAEEFCVLAIAAENALPAELRDPRSEIEVNSVRALILLNQGAFIHAAAAYWRAAELAGTNRYAGLAAIYLAYGVFAAMLGGGETADLTAKARSALALSRASRMPAAIVSSLNALAMTLVDEDPEQARELLLESIDRSRTADGEISHSYISACLVAGRLRDWALTLRLVVRTMYLWRWNMVATLQAAPFLTLAARAVADDRPELAGVLRGAAIHAFSRESSDSVAQAQSTPPTTGTTFLSTALGETRDIVTAALGEERQRALYAAGAAMTADEAISYALANFDRSLLA
ncbi:MAG TPA: adenylate/guanylate cyclase domain-containing protein [Mycobacterium sp.]|nr:adenylate/guanylate cyclase domain-containing protein [Mycobacterium sp.]